MKYFNRREITVFFALGAYGWAAVYPAFADPEKKAIEIFIGGQQYGSLADYRQSQIDRLKKEASSRAGRTGDAQAGSIVREMAQAVVQNVAGPAPGTLNQKMLDRVAEILKQHQPAKQP